MHVVFVSSKFLLTFVLNQCLKGDAPARAQHILEAFLKEFSAGSFKLVVDVLETDAEKVALIQNGLEIPVVDGRVDLSLLEDDESFAERMAEETENRPARRGSFYCS